MDPHEEALSGLQRLVGIALEHDDLGDAMREICTVAASAIPGAAGATMTTFSPSGPGVAAATSEWASELDELQYEELEGPCLDASRTGVVFRIPDTNREPRWPSYMPRAIERGVRSMLSIPMTVETKTIGALNVYSREANAFSAEDVSIAEIVAGHASLANQVATALQHHHQLALQLREALASRATIEQAKGIIMASTNCSPDEAFDRLRDQSSHENRKLRDIAEALVRRYGS